MPNTVSVSPAQPNKLVVNGCDLLNREELSVSQNRELQRYIDANAHLLGFLDKPKDEADESIDNKYGQFKSHTIERFPIGGSGGNNNTNNNANYDAAQNQARHISAPSPASSDYYRRKGVSWSDTNERPRSHSPKASTNDLKSEVRNPYTASVLGTTTNGNNNTARINDIPVQRSYSPAYSTSDKRRTPYDYDQYASQPITQATNQHTRRIDSPWSGSSIWSRDSQPKEHSKEDFNLKAVEIPVYSTLERHPDDYNRYDTYRYRKQHHEGRNTDDSKKFYGYGDHKVSGIELQARRWTGGEVVTDPNLIKKSLKPRRMYYSPIGDGVVEADGVELKRGPKDMTPHLDIRHERYIEKGSPGQAGRRLIEETWCDGNGDGNQNGNSGRRTPYDNDGPKNDGGKPQSHEFKPPQQAIKSNYGKEPIAPAKAFKPSSAGSGFPTDNANDDLLSGPSGRNSALSIGTNGLPREGWTKTFIVNPRELINQYANETQTIIFDLDDHTPKTLVTTKEVIRESPALSRT